MANSQFNTCAAVKGVANPNQGTNLEDETIGYMFSNLISPAVELKNGNLATLTFWHNYDFTGDALLQYGRVLLFTNTQNSGFVTTNREIIDPLGRRVVEQFGAVVERSIEPVVTLYHWDLPQALDRVDTAGSASGGGGEELTAREPGQPRERLGHDRSDLTEPEIVLEAALERTRACDVEGDQLGHG